VHEQLEAHIRVFLSRRSQLLAYVQGMVHDFELAEDLLQDCYIQMQRAIEADKVIEDTYKWCCGTVRNLARMHWRSKRRSKVIFDEGLMQLVEQAFEENETDLDELQHKQGKLRECVGRLSPRSQRAVELRYFRGHDVPDVAEVLSCTTNALNVVLFRARQSLLKCLQKKGVHS
jgi:RNA polymerase sigma-70 factor, ECF subfamily